MSKILSTQLLNGPLVENKAITHSAKVRFSLISENSGMALQGRRQGSKSMGANFHDLTKLTSDPKIPKIDGCN